MKLTIELVPSSCWFSNLRDHLTSAQWNSIKKHTSEQAGHRCEICNGIGRKWPVECHEVWYYDDINKIQRLEKTIALCPLCHKVKHIGYAMVSNTLEPAIKQLIKINKMNESEAYSYINQAFKIFNERSKYQWKLDISWLNNNFDFCIVSKRK